MNDTNKEIAEVFHTLMMQRKPEQRIEMCFSMLRSAKEIIKATIKSKSNWQAELFLRLYGNDFNEPTKQKILAALKKNKECS
jgi:hypothetical protein